MKEKPKHLLLGSKGEALAALYLLEKGYQILHRNWRHDKDEIDLITQHGEQLVIVEVKTRSTSYFGEPETAVTPAKQQKLARAANAYIEVTDYKGELRFDVVSILITGPQTKVFHIEDAFYPVGE